MRNLVMLVLSVATVVGLTAACGGGGSSSAGKTLTVPTVGQISGAGDAPGPSLVLESPSASSVAPTQQSVSESPKVTPAPETTKKSPPPACAKWTTEAKKSPSEAIVQSRLTDAQVLGTDKCFDRVEFVINGVADPKSPVSFVVDWSNGPLTADPNNAPISLKGAILKVVVRAPAQGYANSGPPEEQRMKVDSQLPGKGRVVRDARFAGSFESQSLFGIGLDKQRAFNVTAGVADGKTHVWVDIAVS